MKKVPPDCANPSCSLQAACRLLESNACSFACRALTEDSARCLNGVLVPLISETRCKTRHAPLSSPQIARDLFAVNREVYIEVLVGPLSSVAFEMQ